MPGGLGHEASAVDNSDEVGDVLDVVYSMTLRLAAHELTWSPGQRRVPSRMETGKLCSATRCGTRGPAWGHRGHGAGQVCSHRLGGTTRTRSMRSMSPPRGVMRSSRPISRTPLRNTRLLMISSVARKSVARTTSSFFTCSAAPRTGPGRLSVLLHTVHEPWSLMMSPGPYWACSMRCAEDAQYNSRVTGILNIRREWMR